MTCPWKRLHAAITAWLLAGAAAMGQPDPRITSWRAADGLPQSDVFALSIDPRGHVITTHEPSLPAAQLDGFAITTISNSVGAPSRVHVSRSGQYWSVDRLGLLEQTGGGWTLHALPDIAGEYRGNPIRAIRPIPLLPLDRNRVLYLLPEALLEYDATERVARTVLRAAETPMGRFHELAPGVEDSAWISGARGLVRVPGPLRKVAPDTAFEFVPLPAGVDLGALHRPHEDRSGAVVLAAEGTGPAGRHVLRWERGQWQLWKVDGADLRQAWGGADRELWGHTPTAVVRLIPQGSNALAQVVLPARRIRDVAPQPDGATWVATSEGVFRLAPLPWRPAPGFEPASSPVYDVISDRRGQVVALSPHAIHRLGGGFAWHSATVSGDAREDAPQPGGSLFPLTDGALLVRTLDGTIALDPDGSDRPLPADVADARPLGWLADGRVIFQPDDADSTHLRVFDGMQAQIFAQLPEESSRLGRLTLAMQTRSGELWVGGENGIAVRRGDVWSLLEPEPDQESGALAALELPNGRVLVGGTDMLREYDGRRWRVLRRSLDRVHALHLGRDASLWVASGSGLLRFREDSWFTFGEDEGLTAGPVFSVLEDGAGRLWAGTARGLYLFDAGADLDAPVAEIAGADVPQRAGDARALFVLGGEDRWRFAPTGRLLYSSRLDNNPWSAWRPAGSVQFTNLTAGTHRFSVRSMDPSGNIQTRPATLEFTVSLPWFKDPRLVAASVVVALLLVGMAIQAAISYSRLRRSYSEVERQVAERSAALERANEELLHSHKMRALGTLAAGVAHDFNNLLSIIKGSAQLLEAQISDTERARQRLARIKTAVDQGAGLVRAMLGYSRGAAAPSKTVDPLEVLRGAVRLLEERMPGRLSMTAAPAAVPPVHLPPEMLQQIVLNLVQNADEAMEQRGLVQIEVVPGAACDTWILKPAEAPAYLSIIVRDSGMGIPAENLARIFEPFFTTKGFSSRRGTGLGLSMVYEFAKELGAGISVASTVGVGSEFRIVLPVGPRPEPATGPGGATLTGPARTGQPSTAPQESTPGYPGSAAHPADVSGGTRAWNPRPRSG